jgi:peptide/nickel transport system permease protein
MTGSAFEESAELVGAIEHEGQVVQVAGFVDYFKHTLRSSRVFQIGLFIVFVAVLLAIIGPYVAPYSPTAATAAVNAPPSGAHWFGTDPNGFDIFSRVLAAPRVDVVIALAATFLSLTLGSLIGLITSFFHGFFGEAVMRASDTVQAFPLFVLAIVIVVMAGRNTANIILVIALLNVPIFVRLMRSQVLSLRGSTFVEAARASGDTGLSIAIRQVLPNALTPAAAQASITLGGAILLTAGLSFIGAGVQPPTAEWGAMIASGANGVIIGEWWTAVFPGVAISLTVFGFAAVGLGLQNILLRRT